MVKPSSRTLMINGINDYIVPYFESLGFSLEPSRNVQVFGESKSLYPLGCLIRYSEDEMMDIIEFKFGKYKNSGFEINFAQIPRDGAYHDFGFAPQSETTAFGFGSFGVCQKSRFFASRNFHPSKLKYSIFHTVDRGIFQARKYAPEIEVWFQTRKVGPRLRTQEQLGRGVKVYRGWPSFFILRLVFVSYTTSKDNPDKVTSLEEAEAFAIQKLKEQNRLQKFGAYWLWQAITH